ncbi:MAG: hypothetical protein EBU84_17385, partial [Actinobacteria bacterium]|nr:hypothetical protein [Actinomycetota bacterium]
MDTSVNPRFEFLVDLKGISVGSGSWSPDGMVFTQSFSVADGNIDERDIKAKITGAKDLAGNVFDSDALNVDFIVDTLNPHAPNIKVIDQRVSGPDIENTLPTFEVQGEIGASITVHLNGSNGAAEISLAGTGGYQRVTLSKDQVKSLGEGEVQVSATQVDASGNLQDISPSQNSFTIDLTPPVVAGSGGGRFEGIVVDLNKINIEDGVTLSVPIGLDVSSGLTTVSATIYPPPGQTSFWVITEEIARNALQAKLPPYINPEHLPRASEVDFSATLSDGSPFEVRYHTDPERSYFMNDTQGIFMMNEGLWIDLTKIATATEIQISLPVTVTGSDHPLVVTASIDVPSQGNVWFISKDTVGAKLLAVAHELQLPIDASDLLEAINGHPVVRVHAELSNGDSVEAQLNTQDMSVSGDSFLLSPNHESDAGIRVSTTLITEADKAHEFKVSVSFSEPMDIGTAPNIGFAPDVSSSLTWVTGHWTDDGRNYISSYTVSDDDIELKAVLVGVEGAKDVAGNVMQPYQYQQPMFSIDTQTPSAVDVQVSHVIVTDADVGRTLYVTVKFDESMDTRSVPTVLLG